MGSEMCIRDSVVLELLALPVCHVILLDLLDEVSVSLVDVFDDEIHVVDSAVYPLAVVDGGVLFPRCRLLLLVRQLLLRGNVLRPLLDRRQDILIMRLQSCGFFLQPIVL